MHCKSNQYEAHRYFYWWYFQSYIIEVITFFPKNVHLNGRALGFFSVLVCGDYWADEGPSIDDRVMDYCCYYHCFKYENIWCTLSQKRPFVVLICLECHLLLCLCILIWFYFCVPYKSLTVHFWMVIFQLLFLKNTPSKVMHSDIDEPNNNPSLPITAQ